MANRRDLILAALKAAGASGISGEVVARDLMISRVAVSKHITALRKEGYEIEARHGKGYNLIACPDLPLPAEVRPLLKGRHRLQLTGGQETASTNDQARLLARSGAEEGTVVLAPRQTKGRGRLGRDWESPEGGVYLSIVLRPEVSPAELAPLPLVMALGVAVGLESIGAAPKLKWPNDVFLGSGKVSGILLEMTAESDRVDWVVVGVGLNVRPQRRRADGASYVGDAVPDASTASVAAAVLDAMMSEYERWLREGFGPARAEYLKRHLLGDSEVVVRDTSGAIKVEGTVTGLDDLGRLLVAHDGMTDAVCAGDATLKAAS